VTEQVKTLRTKWGVCKPSRKRPFVGAYLPPSRWRAPRRRLGRPVRQARRIPCPGALTNAPKPHAFLSRCAVVVRESGRPLASSVMGDDRRGTPQALRRNGMTLLDDWGAAGCGGCRASSSSSSCLSAALATADGRRGGPPRSHGRVQPHAAASTLPTAFADRSRGGSESSPVAAVTPRSTPTRLPARC
jgi:hypothetical protein